MRSLIEYFDCGNLYKSREAFEYRVEKFSDPFQRSSPPPPLPPPEWGGKRRNEVPPRPFPPPQRTSPPPSPISICKYVREGRGKRGAATLGGLLRPPCPPSLPVSIED